VQPCPPRHHNHRASLMWAGQAETRPFIVVDPGYEVDPVDWDTPNQPHNQNQPSNSARQSDKRDKLPAWRG
jgi:hypothetical protein